MKFVAAVGLVPVVAGTDCNIARAVEAEPLDFGRVTS